MSEEETQTSEPAPETPEAEAEVKPEGETPSTLSILDQAKETAERLEKLKKESLEILKKNEKLIAEIKLSGGSIAGTKTKTSEEILKDTAEAEAKKIVERFI